MASRYSAGVKPNADKDLHSPGRVRGLGKRQHLPSTVRAAKGYETPASVCGGTGSGGPRGRQIDPAGRREPGNRRERVIVISITGREPRRARKTRIFLQHVHASL